MKLVKDNDYAIVFEPNASMKLVQIRAGDKFQTHAGGAFRSINVIGCPWGSKIMAYNKPDSFVHVVQPKSTLIT